MNNSSGKFKDVIGYMTEAERIALQRCVLETTMLDGDALEIGSLNGLSALLILSVLRSDKTLICIEQGQCETLFHNLVKYEHAGQVAIKNEDFNKVELKPETKISFAFIDHDHSYVNNMAAFNKLLGYVLKGGIIALHDNGNPIFEGGTKAIEDIKELAEKYQTFLEYMRADSFIAFQKL